MRANEHNLDTQTLHLLQQTTQYFSEHAHNQRQTYLVGGSLRNILLGEQSLDWDIVITGDAHKIAHRLADKLGGHYVQMHEKASRVVVVLANAASSTTTTTTTTTTKKEICFDISPLNGKTIEDDLRQRDFTINAIAAPLDEVVRYNTESSYTLHLIDPLNGLADLNARRLKAVNEYIFQRDPLRMLRAVRLGMRYKLHMDPWTEDLIVQDARMLPQVAQERVHDELYAILGPGGAAERLHFLDKLGLFTVIFPEFATARGLHQPSPHHWDVLEHSIETVGALERVARMMQHNGEHNTELESDLAEIRVLLCEAEAQGFFSFEELTMPRMKMAALLHDIGKTVTFSSDEEGGIHYYNHPLAGVPLVEQMMKRLCASAPDRRLAQLVSAHHMRPGQLGQDGPVTPRAIRRYFVDLGPTGIYVALISLADHLATLGPQPTNDSWQRHLGVVRLLLTSYIRERESILPPRLISPEELMRRLKLDPGPIVGQLLDLIAEAQAEGTIHSKEEAVWFAEEYEEQLVDKTDQ